MPASPLTGTAWSALPGGDARGAATLPVTGGGMLAVVTRELGLVGLHRGADAEGIAVAARSEGTPLPPGVGLAGGLGCWARVVPLAGGGRLLERGLLPDLPAPVVQWTLEADAPLPLEVALGAGGADVRRALVLEPGATVAVALLPAGPEGDRLLSLLRPLAARELQRQGRRREDGASSFALRVEPAHGPPLAPCLLILDDSALGVDRQGRPEGPFLLGLDGRRPRFLSGGELAEAGLGALLAGNRELARAILGELAASDDGGGAAPLAFVHLAARWALWTGDAPALLPLRKVLERAAARLTAGSDPGRSRGGAGGRPAALPPPARALELLADAVEPLGRTGWRGRLLGQSHRAAGPPDPAGLALPVLGSPGSAAAARGPSSPLLPPPLAYGPPGEPAFLHRRTLQAARLVRSWVEGELGAEGDAGWGRLHLSPRMPRGLRDLELRGLALGDARISLDCRVRGGTCTFRLVQEAGRVPVNVIFGPTLPLRAVERIRLGGEDIGVDVEASDGRARIRCQFPLDPERRLIVDGTA